MATAFAKATAVENGKWQMANGLRLLVNLSRGLLHSRFPEPLFSTATAPRQNLERWRLFLEATLPHSTEAEKRRVWLSRLETLLEP